MPEANVFHRARRKLRSGVARLELRGYLMGVFDRSALTLPDFLGIGLMKTGTTWLYENLRRHPQIVMSEEKELGFFNRRMSRGLRWYASRFPSTDAGVRGEITPGYASLPRERIELIHRLMPDARLLLLLRDPVEWEWSTLAHRLRNEGRRIDAVDPDELLTLLDAHRMLRRGGYTGVLDRWTAVWGREPLWIGFYETIARDPRGLLRSVFDHLGVDPEPRWEEFPLGERIVPPNLPGYEQHDPRRGVTVDDYRSPSDSMPAEVRAVRRERWAEEDRRLRARFGDALPW